MTKCNKCGSENIIIIHKRVEWCFDGSMPNDHGGTYCDDCGAKVIMEEIRPPENVINLSVVRMLRKLDKHWGKGH